MASTAAAVGLTPAVRSRWYSVQDARSGLGRVGTRWPDACWAGELTGCSSGGLGGSAGGTGQLAAQRGGQVAGGLAVRAGRAEDQLALVGALGGLDRGDVRIQGAGAVGRIDRAQQVGEVGGRLDEGARQLPAAGGQGVGDGPVDVAGGPAGGGEAVQRGGEPAGGDAG